MGRPSTSSVRPSIPGPTGTVMGLPVERTGNPRDRPSVASSAMHRTAPARCWLTSTATSLSLSCTYSRVLIGGNSPAGKATSSTGPMILCTVPFAIFSPAFSYWAGCGLPAMISDISWVMTACLAWFRSRLSLDSMSLAFLVAASIAVMRALCSQA